MIRPVLSILALVLLLVASVGRSTALAAGTLDQSYTATPNLFADIDSSISFKQTYTAGISGTLDHITVYLTKVDLSGATPPLKVQILNSKKTVLGTTSAVPELAAQALKAGLVDELQLFVTPDVVGGGKRSLPNQLRVQLELLDERSFTSGVVYLHYRIRT
jgi:RibD C-terminal domain